MKVFNITELCILKRLIWQILCYVYMTTIKIFLRKAVRASGGIGAKVYIVETLVD